MHKLVFDIESNGLYFEASCIWVLCTVDIDTGVERCFSDLDNRCEPLSVGIEYLRTADWLIGHNIVQYDLPVLKKICGLEYSGTVMDTMLMSQTCNYKRFGNRGHSLEVWGEFLGVPKPEILQWTVYDPEFLHRCTEDVRINLRVWGTVWREFLHHRKNNPLIALSLRNEHKVSSFVSDACIHGWPFDIESALALSDTLTQQMGVTESEINPLLGYQLKRKDTDRPRLAKYLKDGRYDQHTANWFSVDQMDSFLGDDEPIAGPFNRVYFEPIGVGQIELVKGYLYSIGWEPDEWTMKKLPSGQWEKGGPKMSTSSLLPLGRVGELLDRYYTLRSRLGMVNSFVDDYIRHGDGCVHGSMFVIGTPTGRATHKLIVNVPGAESEFGPELRKLFVAPPGMVIVGADSAGNQMRAFLHYLKNDEYTKIVIEGDVHTENMKILQEVVADCTRKKAKPFLYAFLFGGGNEKLALIVTGKRNPVIGKKLKEMFMDRVTGLKQLDSWITQQFEDTKERGAAYITCVDGRRIYSNSKHKSLNYLLQSMEAVTCKAAVAMACDTFVKEGIEYVPLIMMHDEFEVAVHPHNVERVKEIMKNAFRDAPKQFGVMVMDGEAKSGGSWYDVH
jgi:DNA polymerase I